MLFVNLIFNDFAIKNWMRDKEILLFTEVFQSDFSNVLCF